MLIKRGVDVNLDFGVCGSKEDQNLIFMHCTLANVNVVNWFSLVRKEPESQV